jgi:metal-responsive CopG/Arc/MetJ family transcriptional regulator
MSKSISDNTKRRGRPVTTGKGTLIGVRILDDPLAKLDEWIARQKEEISRPEAIRRLVEQALRAKPKS